MLDCYTLVGSADVTPADRADAEALLALRRLLVADDRVRARLEVIALTEAHADYVAAVDRLSADLEGHLTPGEIDHIARRCHEGGHLPPPTLVLYTGNDRPRARTPTASTLRLVAESLAGRAAGATAGEADERAADGDYRQRQDIAVYRRRLRELVKRRQDAGPAYWRSPTLGLTP